MSREIKFRAWDSHNKRMIGWHDPIFINLDCNGFNITTTTLCQHPFEHVNSESNFFKYLQFTGLTDKNGKEIWEGDRASVSGHWNNSFVEFLGSGWHLVKVDSCIGLDNGGDDIHPKECEVIGHIYE